MGKASRLAKVKEALKKWNKIKPDGDSKDISDGWSGRSNMANMDWGDMPVMKDGHVAVGYQTAPMAADEIPGGTVSREEAIAQLFDGRLPPYDMARVQASAGIPQKYWRKEQFITPEGEIRRTISNADGPYMRWKSDGESLTDPGKFLDKWDLDHDVERKGLLPGKWLQDDNGNWYQSGPNLRIPKEAAADMKRYYNGVFTDVPMNRKYPDGVEAGNDEQRLMRDFAKRNARRDNDPLSPYGDVGGNTNLMHKLKGKRAEAQEYDAQQYADQAAAAAYENYRDWESKIREAIAEVERLKNLKSGAFDFWSRVNDQKHNLGDRTSPYRKELESK